MQNIKIFLFLSIGMFFIAVLLGIISGNSFGLIFTRAILSGVIIGGLGFLLSFFLKQFVPIQENHEKNTEKHDQELGSNIDVTLPEENPHLEHNMENGMETIREETQTENIAAEVPESKKINDDKNDNEESTNDPVVDPVQKTAVDAGSEKKIGNTPAANQELPETNMEPVKPVADNNANAIPDISDIVNSNEADELEHKPEAINPAESADQSNFKLSSLGNSKNAADIDESPSTLAKAIRTVIAKDNK